MTDTRIPVTILTGYLGSGKTTIVNYIIKNTDRKISVIVNEVGEVDIDGILIEKNTQEVLKFSDKCMCCAVRGDIVESVINMLNRFSPEAILIETSGLAHPLPIAMSIKEDEISNKCRIDSIICVVDAENIFSVIEQDDMLLEQLESADMIIITKSDLVPNKKLEEVTNYVKRLKPQTPLIISKKGEIDFNIIFDTNLSEWVSIKTDDKHLHNHFETKSIVIKEDISKKRFVKFMDNLSKEIYRAKGIVSLDKKYYHFNKVGNRWEMEIFEGERIIESNLVFIGKNLLELDELIKNYLYK